VFQKHGVPITMSEARAPMGLRKDLHIAQILKIPAVQERWKKVTGSVSDQKTVDKLFADFVPMQMAVLDQYSDLIPGTVEAVNALRQKYNLKIGLTTGFTRVMVDKLLANAKAQGFEPDTSVAGDDVPNNMGFRPAPFMVYQNICNLGVFPIHTVVKVDDTITGVGEGVNAGCWTIGIAGWSNYTDVDSLEHWAKMRPEEQEKRRQRSRDLLRESGAHYVVDTISEVPACVEDINQHLKSGKMPDHMARDASS